MNKYYKNLEYVSKVRPNYTYKRMEENGRPNLVKRNYKVDIENKIWCTDITYLILNGKHAVLSTILDLYDRKIICYIITKFNNNQLVIDTLNEAIAKRKNGTSLLIHSDQGYQYTSFEYKAICESNGITFFMSRKGTPILDLPMESFHAILKKETLYNNNISSLQGYIMLVEDWILFYNPSRLKSKKGSDTNIVTSFQKVFLFL